MKQITLELDHTYSELTLKQVLTQISDNDITREYHKRFSICENKEYAKLGSSERIFENSPGRTRERPRAFYGYFLRRAESGYHYRHPIYWLTNHKRSLSSRSYKGYTQT